MWSCTGTNYRHALFAIITYKGISTNFCSFSFRHCKETRKNLNVEIPTGPTITKWRWVRNVVKVSWLHKQEKLTKNTFNQFRNTEVSFIRYRNTIWMKKPERWDYYTPHSWSLSALPSSHHSYPPPNHPHSLHPLLHPPPPPTISGNLLNRKQTKVTSNQEEVYTHATRGNEM